MSETSVHASLMKPHISRAGKVSRTTLWFFLANWNVPSGKLEEVHTWRSYPLRSSCLHQFWALATLHSRLCIKFCVSQTHTVGFLPLLPPCSSNFVWIQILLDCERRERKTSQYMIHFQKVPPALAVSSSCCENRCCSPASLHEICLLSTAIHTYVMKG